MSDDEGSDNGEPQYQVVYDGEDASKSKPDRYLRRDGRAAAKFANEDTYVGEYLNGKRHGRGVYVFASSGARYEGEYSSGLKQGRGKFLYPDGSVYDGEWAADKKEGQGTMVYASGDAYSGGWVADKKHGKGTYTYASNGSAITGEWSNGQIMHGAWSMADGSRYTGAWHKNQPNGLGLHAFANGSQAVGFYGIDRKQGYKWSSTAPKLSSGAAPAGSTPAAPTTPADPLKVATRFIEKALLKLDHFEGIYKLKKEVEGCPNLRKVADAPIFALGQPTRPGLTSFAEWASEQHGVDKFLWVNFRAEPVVYVNESSFVPRSKHALNEPMSLRGLGSKPLSAAGEDKPEPLLTAAQLATVEDALVAKLTKDIAHRGNLHLYLKDTFAEQAQDRRNIQLSEEVKVDEETGDGSFGSAIQSPAAVFQALSEDGGVDIEYVRLPVPSGGRIPPPESIDVLVQLLKAQDAATGLVFNDQMGRGRATLGAVVATLMRRTSDALAQAEERGETNPAALGRTDMENLDLPEFDDADPNLRLGQYALVMRLVRALGPAGEQIKAEVDDALDRCKHMQHLRECILFAKENHEREVAAQSQAQAQERGAPHTHTHKDKDEDGSRARFWIETAQNFVERYAHLLLFQAYVKANIETEYEQQTFAQFLDSKKDLLTECIGTRQAGPLKDFRWQ